MLQFKTAPVQGAETAMINRKTISKWRNKGGNTPIFQAPWTVAATIIIEDVTIRPIHYHTRGRPALA